jgi:hypothetical protein
MNTLFHISTYLLHLHPGLQSFEQGTFPVSMNISVSGPQGPVGPAHQKLSSSGKKNILSLGIPQLNQMLAASSSLGILLLPSNTVTFIFSGFILSSFVKNS